MQLVRCDTVDLIKGYFLLHYLDDATKTDVFIKPKMFEEEYQIGDTKHSFDPEIEVNINEKP